MHGVVELDSAPILLPDEHPSAEAIRREHILAEADVKTIGHLVLIGVVLEIFALLRSPGMSSVNVVLLGVIAATGMGGMLLRALEPLGRWIYTAGAMMGLVTVALEWPTIAELVMQDGARLVPPSDYLTVVMLGGRAVIPPVLVAILWSRKRRAVTSAHYRSAVIPASPHVEARSNSLLLLGALGVALLCVVACSVLVLML